MKGERKKDKKRGRERNRKGEKGRGGKEIEIKKDRERK
jgi:hypothetical protein